MIRRREIISSGIKNDEKVIGKRENSSFGIKNGEKVIGRGQQASASEPLIELGEALDL